MSTAPATAQSGPARPAPGLLLACALATSGLACESHAPAARPPPPPTPVATPAALALAEPCRYLGTFHRESRSRLEQLRICRALSAVEWECAARALQQLDRDATARCQRGDVAGSDLAAAQLERYVPCIADTDAARCAVLSLDRGCLDLRCGAAR